MPAMFSLSALNERLAMDRAVGLFSRISSHHFCTSASSSSWGTTALTRPQSSACWAVYLRHRYQISRARFSPIRRDR
ncbi:hypothetical protein D3C85_1667680 [compost metagenome]